MRDRRDVVRIELHVRIALRMDVAHGAIQLRRYLEQLERGCGFEVSRRAGLNARVAGLLDQHGQPADFELGARGDDEIRAARSCDEAGFGLDAMHILQSRRGDVDVDALAAELGGESTPSRGWSRVP